MAVDVEGKVVKANSQYVKGLKVMLLDIDFDSFLSDKILKTLYQKIYERSQKWISCLY